jgi:hypothetical protein
LEFSLQDAVSNFDRSYLNVDSNVKQCHYTVYENNGHKNKTVTSHLIQNKLEWHVKAPSTGTHREYQKGNHYNNF